MRYNEKKARVSAKYHATHGTKPNSVRKKEEATASRAAVAATTTTTTTAVNDNGIGTAAAAAAAAAVTVVVAAVEGNEHEHDNDNISYRRRMKTDNSFRYAVPLPETYGDYNEYSNDDDDDDDDDSGSHGVWRKSISTSVSDLMHLSRFQLADECSWNAINDTDGMNGTHSSNVVGSIDSTLKELLLAISLPELLHIRTEVFKEETLNDFYAQAEVQFSLVDHRKESASDISVCDTLSSSSPMVVQSKSDEIVAEPVNSESIRMTITSENDVDDELDELLAASSSQEQLKPTILLGSVPKPEQTDAELEDWLNDIIG